MSKHEKLLERLRDPQRDNGWNFADLCQLLQNTGFKMRQSASHHFFRKTGVPEVINLQPRGSEAKGYQVHKRAKCFRVIDCYEQSL